MNLATDIHVTYESLLDAVQNAAIEPEILLPLPPGYRIILLDHQHRGLERWVEVGLINDIESSVVWYWKAAVSHLAQIDRWIAIQKAAWCSPGAQHATVLRGFSQQIFLKLVIPRYDLVVSDDPQEGSTSDRWLKQLSVAISLGLHVYTYQRDVKVLGPLPTQGALDDFVDQIWSAPNKLGHQKALISLSSLLSGSLLLDEALLCA